jgi:hypothetical protein
VLREPLRGSSGATHDICSTVTLDDLEGMGLTEVLLSTFAQSAS